ncbi:c-type cytochrome [Bradyrhizobium sp. Ash2021]|uniref:c-type cytochrome n=1 Tax=Bradyrhizobium sp. Ash2021 TaxID=2954771 RepID=UPI002814FF73|nr:transporter substrate-binding domain-containing protein [Bradyrhizobium sp. Ash2021]WMT73376.1 transporter substrate-binding domain-containing protein [Bradyrhizobium sp. Ash2021]
MPATHLDKRTTSRTTWTHASIPTLAVILSLAAPAFRAGADEIKPLRLCADPTNLPFSSDNASMPGFYLELGQALGKALGRPVAYNWYKSYFGKRTVRVTLLGKQCDAMIGLPLSEDFMGPAVIFSKPLITEAYVLVSAKDGKVSSIDDLKGKRVAVQFLSTPQNLLAQLDEIEKVTVLSPEEGMKVLDQGKADVAFIWGPVAGWLNKTEYGDRYAIQSTEGLGLSWISAVGFAKTSIELRDQVDAALPSLETTIAGLIAKYGFPTDRPVKFNAAPTATKHAFLPASQALPIVLAQLTTVAAATPEAVSAGREVFNGTCAHCHGPDAVQSERRIDLRLLNRRYGDDMRETYWKTVHEGRPSKGMPAWNEVFTDEQLDNVYAYLLTLQTPSN